MASSQKKKSKTSAAKTPVKTVRLDPYARAFTALVPADDVKGWKPQSLGLVAEMMSGFAAERKAGDSKIRVFTPDLTRDGWEMRQTVIMMINDDMPFIVDSVSSEVSFRGLSIDILLHPILAIQRDGRGRVATIGEGQAESHIFIQLDQLLSDEAAASLQQSLVQAMRDVGRATGDWKKMTKKLDDVTAHAAAITGHDWSDVKEARDFLGYIKSNNFTFLGYREYSVNRSKASSVAGSSLGVLREDALAFFTRPAELEALAASRWPVMVSKMIDVYATVHRRVPMDAVFVKAADEDGNITGVHVFVGLFTSSTYSCRTSEVPIVRQKAAETVVRTGFVRGSHDHKALEHILEKMPRDELFQVSVDELYDLSLGILRLQAKKRVALFTHLDPMKRYMSCLIYVPRDRYNTHFRLEAGKILEQSLKGKVTNYFTTLDDSSLARVLFTVLLDGAATYDHVATEQKLVDLGREWDERLKQVLISMYGKVQGADMAERYGRGFSLAYHAATDIRNAPHDIRQIETLLADPATGIRVDFYRHRDDLDGEYSLKAYNNGAPVPLSDIVPKLENMGLKTISEMPFEVHPQASTAPIWIHDFSLRGTPGIDIAKVKANFEETFLQVWRGMAEDDGLNRLVFAAGLNWREVMMLRAYSSYMRQARLPFSKTSVEQVLSLYPDITRQLVAFFMAKHDPKAKAAKGAERGQKEHDSVIEMLARVQKLDHDRILRAFLNLIGKTLRTSYFQTDDRGAPKAALAMKLDSKNIADLPLPRPHVEIYVYSPRVEAIHLRGGEIARGGIRWSDRHDDFRTEVLGLMKSQQVKNTVIVPVGAKGGFVVKQPPATGGREAYAQEGIECYKIFVQALLDLTDNNIKGEIIRPKDTVCHDGIDPYLVVAADKGTATFSDIANSLSVAHGFWLGDAFASGGGTGYDHKKMAITARGGWESVKRHFREIGKDIQTEPFTMVGVGDMAGDVFGNALLLSKQIRLVGAFNHVHIFCDPEPDIAASFAERQRLFKARGGWDAYDTSKISTGGGVFERSAKSIKLTPQIRKCFGISGDSVTPDELIKAILKAEVELIWFGGIGTFVKSSRQSNADADDKSNDNTRIDATDIRARVVGEGANLGTTQLSRIEYARNGGRINTDFIDNSAGVDCSDHEVNIKILLTDVMARGKMTIAQRNKLLVDMTDDVAALVLKDNYQQTQSLSLQLHSAREHLGLHAEYIRTLEKEGILKRSLEGLPDEEGFARLAKEGHALTRPELAILTSYAKIQVYKQILASNLPDDPACTRMLFDYFPKALHKYEKEILGHKLKRQIIATEIVNRLVNRMGPVFVASRMAKTGASAEDVARAYLIVEEGFGLSDIWKQIEDLDNKVPSQVQLQALNEIFLTVKRAVTWFLRFRAGDLGKIAATVAVFRPAMETLCKDIEKIVPEGIKERLLKSQHHLTQWGMPIRIAEAISALQLLSSAGDIIQIASDVKADIRTIARIYFEAGEKLGLDGMRDALSQLVVLNSWQARIRGSVLDDLYHHQARMTLKLADRKKPLSVADWFADNASAAAKISALLGEIRAEEKPTIEMYILASQRVGRVVG